jgi:hypothetical protein
MYEKIIIIFLLFISATFSQQSITWQRLYNGPQSRDDEGYAICNSDSNNFYIGGMTRFTSSPTFRPYIIKINPYGDTIWTKVILINGTAGGWVYALLPTQDGGCIVTGEANLKFLIRIDRNGSVVWQYTYSGLVIYYDIKRANNGDFICTGFYQSGGTALRIDTLGNVKWDKLYPNNFFHTLQTTVDNGCLVVGYTGVDQAIVIKLDSSGNVTNTKIFNINNQQTHATSFEKDNSNNYILSGNYWNGTKDVPYFIKLDFNLNPLDTHIFTQIKSEIAHSMKTLSNGKYVWTFYYETFPPDSSFNRFLITDENGNILHQKIKYNKAFEEFVDIKPVNNGDIIFVGTAEYSSNPTAFNDIFTIRSDSLLNFPSNVIGIKIVNSSLPHDYRLYQNYPNPFNPQTTIRYDIPAPFTSGTHVTLVIYDILGKEVKTLVNEYKKTGRYTAEFDGSNLASGVYFYKISVHQAGSSTGNYVETKKMVLIK